MLVFLANKDCRLDKKFLFVNVIVPKLVALCRLFRVKQNGSVTKTQRMFYWHTSIITAMFMLHRLCKNLQQIGHMISKESGSLYAGDNRENIVHKIPWLFAYKELQKSHPNPSLQNKHPEIQVSAPETDGMVTKMNLHV